MKKRLLMIAAVAVMMLSMMACSQNGQVASRYDVDTIETPAQGTAAMANQDGADY